MNLPAVGGLEGLNLMHFLGEAPGRLDFLGGVADYSGALVLQMPIAATTRVEIVPLAEPTLRVCSDDGHGAFATPAAPLLRAAAVPSYPPNNGGGDEPHGDAPLRAALEAVGAPPWTRYVLGCLLLFCRAKTWAPAPATGLEFAVTSDVPQGMGVSSSAALEVATLRALSSALAASSDAARGGWTGTELARLAQRAENHLVGVPCGLMDQLASAHGRPGALLPILCRPDLLRAPVALPRGLAVVGWPSGVRHAVGDSPYAAARTAAFMGKQILVRRLERSLAHAAELTPAELLEPVTGRPVLPETLSGGDFLQTYGGVDDPLSTVGADRVYPVRAALGFAVEENFRAGLAMDLLAGAGAGAGPAAPGASEGGRERLARVGELMFLSHAGYSAMGLGCPETDAMVMLCRRLGPSRGVYGARVSGGGSGGTVVVLLEADRGHAALETARQAEDIAAGHALIE